MEWLEPAFFASISLLLRAVSGLSPYALIAIVAALLAVAYGVGCLIQRRLRRQVEKRPHRSARLARLEASLSVLLPFALIYFFLEGIIRGLRGWLLRRRERRSESPQFASPQSVPGGDRTPAPHVPVRVATIGPTFLFAGLVTGGLSWLAWLTDPFFARAFEVSPGHSFWQYFLLGQRPELGWLLPLEDRPLVAILLCLMFWLVVWWTLGNLLRGVVFRSALERNHGLSRQGEEDETLPIWASGFGVEQLVEPSQSYRRWATWLVSAAIVLIVLGTMTMGGDNHHASPSAIAVGLVITLSWVLHLRLRGFAIAHKAGVAEDGADDAPALDGWPQVEEELARRYGCAPVSPCFARKMYPLDRSVLVRDVSAFSPLTAELIPELGDHSEASQGPRLTRMQHRVLRSLSLLAHVHLPAPLDDEELTLIRSGAQEVEDRSGLGERHQVVLAPEGSGKTTLGLLAAANHAVVHARATLIITRSEAQADDITSRIRAAVEPSMLRWNLRFRRVGRDFASDLSRDIVPDVVVVSLRQLVTSLLDNQEVYDPFLRHVGLVVVDDVESFAGAVEIHAQLAFRRLRLLFRQRRGVEYLGEENAPLMLVLGVDSMKQTATWAQNLCGIQAAIRTFRAEMATPDAQQAPDVPMVCQRGYRLADLLAESGRALTVAEVVAACERCEVPWHYRPAGDGRRELGRGPLLLDAEPDHACASPSDACVLLIEGRWSEVRREVERLPWAGCDSGRGEIAIVTIVDTEDALACGLLEPGFGFEPEDHHEAMPALAGVLRSLPWPIIRPPSSLAVQSHLLADLLQQWIEVKDLVDTFGAPVADSLRWLERQGMLHTQGRRDVKPELKEYEPKVYVRALVTSLQIEAPENRTEGVIELSPFDKVRQVELVSPRAVRVRNRANQSILARVEAQSAGIVYYPGRVFEDARGRFVVVGRVREGRRVSDIEVESALFADRSSPRRKFTVRRNPSLVMPYPLVEPESLLLGRDPIELGLVAVEARIRTVGTYRIDRITGEILSRVIHEGPTIQEQFPPTPFATVALLLIPNPEDSPANAPRLRFGEARLLATLLRYLIPLVYRDTRNHFEVALSITGPEHAGDGSSTETMPDRPLLASDGFYILDLHQGGNGTARAIHRDGLGLPLRLCRHFLRTVTDFSRLVRLFDHWGDPEEILEDGPPEDQAGAARERENTRLAPDGAETLGRALDALGLAVEPKDAPDQEAEASPRDGEVAVGVDHETDGARKEENRLADVDADADVEQVVSKAPEPSRILVQGLLDWLDSRLHPEAIVKASAFHDRDAEEATDGEGRTHGSEEAA